MHSKRFGRPRTWALLVTAAVTAVAVSALVAATGGAAGDPSVVANVSARNITAAGSGAPDIVDVSSLPQAQSGGKGGGQAKPFLSPLGKDGLARAKADAAKQAPEAETVLPLPVQASASDDGPFTPRPFEGFEGLANSGTICSYFGGNGCQPPDQAIASSGSYVLQGVNTSIAVYDGATGALQAGFPKSLQEFLDVPAPRPSGCDSAHGNQPFLSDPRAARDPETGRWYVAALQVEDAFGIAPNCNFLSMYHVAVSATTNPLGRWNIYHFDTSNLVGSGNSAADYTQLGFNTEAIFIGGNQFNQPGTAYNGAWTLAIPKEVAESGGSIPSISGFGGYMANDGTQDRLLDTVQPVISYGAEGGPPGELLISSFNEAVTENKVVVLDFSNALAQDGKQQKLTAVVARTKPYSQPPPADNYPACQDCLETIDNRISATPVYMHGNIYAAHDTAVNNGTATNANIHWMIVHPTLDQTAVEGCSVCSKITSETAVVDNEYLTYQGKTDDWFGAIQPDREANVFMAYEYVSTTAQVSPSSALIARRATVAPGPRWGGPFKGHGRILREATNATSNSRWGDYEAVGFESWDRNGVVVATEYAAPGTQGWATHIDRVKYARLTQN